MEDIKASPEVNLGMRWDPPVWYLWLDWNAPGDLSKVTTTHEQQLS